MATRSIVARVRPLGADGEVVGARIVRERHLDVVAEAEAGPQGQLAAVLLCVVKLRRDVEVRLRRRDHVETADVAPLAQVELRRRCALSFAGSPFWIAHAASSSSSTSVPPVPVYGVIVSTL